jgi:hypothetical protein
MRRIIALSVLLAIPLLWVHTPGLAAFNTPSHGLSDEVQFVVGGYTGFFNGFLIRVIKKNPAGVEVIQKKHPRFTRFIGIRDLPDLGVKVLKKDPAGVERIQKKGPQKTR